MVGRRTVLLAALGLIPGAFALVSDLGLVALVAWDLLLMAAFAVDAAMVRRLHEQQLVVERAVRTHLLHGVEEMVKLTIKTDSSDRALQAIVIDEAPRDLLARDVVEIPQPMRLIPGGIVELEYAVRPRRRGRAEFGAVNLLIDGPLALARRRVVIVPRGVSTVHVYPNIGDLDKSALNPELMLQELGIKRVRKRMEGTEFESLRDAVIDDELRRLDWRATARRGRLTARNFELERNHEVLLCLDTGRLMGALHQARPTMDTEDVAVTKLDQAIAAGLRLASVALRYGDRVGLLTFDADVGAFVRPDRGRAQIGRLLEAAHDLEAASSDASYARALMEVRRRQKKRSLIVFLTDFADLETSSAMVDVLSLLARRHAVLFVALRDPHIREVADGAIEDLPSTYRSIAAMSLEEARAEVIEGLSSRGVRALDLPPESVTTGAIQAYLALRAAERF